MEIRRFAGVEPSGTHLAKGRAFPNLPLSMTSALKVIAVSGSTHLPSRTLVLAQALIAGLERELAVESQIINLGDIARPLGSALSRAELPKAVEDSLQAIETADLLLVASPVYRGSLPGLLKHLFDLIDQEALVDIPVILAATGGSDRHALVIDHQLRPLFSFFQALTLPIGVYAATADFDGYQIASESLQARVRLAIDRAVPLFAAQHALPRKAA